MGEDFVWFLLMILILIFPFVSIYLILFTLNWNDKKNLLSDSWFVFLAWLISSHLVFFVCLFLGIAPFSGFISNTGFVFLVFIASICATAAVLYLRTRGKMENLSFADNYADEAVHKSDILNIWRTSVIVSFLTLVMVMSLLFALIDISQKMEKDKPEKESENGISFAID